MMAQAVTNRSGPPHETVTGNANHDRFTSSAPTALLRSVKIFLRMPL